jgi:hypothetical protein
VDRFSFIVIFTAISWPYARDVFLTSDFLRFTVFLGFELDAAPLFDAKLPPAAPQVSVNPSSLDAILADLSNEATSYAHHLGSTNCFAVSANHWTRIFSPGHHVR